MFRNAVHPDNHGDDEKRGHQQKQPFKSVFADIETLERNGDGEAESHGSGHATPDKADQMGPIGPRQINQDNADDEGGFDTLTKGDEEGREHKRSS
jgi:hypothetical protein